MNDANTYRILLDVITIVFCGVVGYLALRERLIKSEIINEIEKYIRDRIQIVENEIKILSVEKSERIKEIDKQTHDIESFVQSEIKVLKSQLIDRDKRLDKLEEKIDCIHNKINLIQEMIFQIAQAKQEKS